MKKKISCFAIIICFFLTSCNRSYPYYDMEIQTEGMDYLTYMPQDLNDLEEFSEVIVSGKIKGDHQEITASGPWAPTLTLSTLEITKVYKGNFQEGDTLTLCEWYHIDENDGQKTLVQYCNYMPCEIGREYLFFVNTYRSSDNWENVYTPSIFEMGRYPAISSNARTNTAAADCSVEELNLVIDDTHYRTIYQEVIEKYF